MKQVISVEEARKILGNDADSMSDKEFEQAIKTLHLLAKDTVEQIRHKLLMKRDAKRLAELIYKVYKEEKVEVHNNPQ